MKKHLLFIICPLLLIISCTTKPTVEDLNSVSAPTENIDSNEAQPIEEIPDVENTETQDEPNTTDDEADLEAQIDSPTENQDEELDVFTEPEVFDLEYTEPPAEKDDEIILEPVATDDIPLVDVLPTQNNDEDNNEAVDSSVQNINIQNVDNIDSDIDAAPGIDEDSDDTTDNDIEVIDNSNVIDIENQDNANEEELIEEDSKEKTVITPSRSMKIEKGRYIDVSYPGSGWIYLGIEDGTKSITYFGRKLGTKDTVFTLYAKEAGSRLLHFYKNDPLTGQYIDDYLEVVVENKVTNSKDHISAPEYKEIVPAKPEVKKATLKKEETTVNKSNNAVATVETPTDSESNEEPIVETVSVINPEEELKNAYTFFESKDYSSALNSVNLFLANTVNKVDEGLFLKGNILEAQSNLRNIKDAISTYEELTKNYPSSNFWDRANKRITYLKRFYMEGR